MSVLLYLTCGSTGTAIGAGTTGLSGVVAIAAHPKISPWEVSRGLGLRNTQDDKRKADVRSAAIRNIPERGMFRIENLLIWYS
ncbi:MAG: hypothetical protein OEZ34_17325 [Spirochaetia bacterium]|nr:hypothetical protein [Spirochaetia bacterium]